MKMITWKILLSVARLRVCGLCWMAVHKPASTRPSAASVSITHTAEQEQLLPISDTGRKHRALLALRVIAGLGWRPEFDVKIRLAWKCLSPESCCELN